MHGLCKCYSILYNRNGFGLVMASSVIQLAYQALLLVEHVASLFGWLFSVSVSFLGGYPMSLVYKYSGVSIAT